MLNLVPQAKNQGRNKPMTCKKCPHHVQHGQVAADGKTFEFKDRCGLRIKEGLLCSHYPFAKFFDYTNCEVYKNNVKGALDRKDVMPTQDFQFSDAFNSGSLADMELL